jgi:hypothetical protein
MAEQWQASGTAHSLRAHRPECWSSPVQTIDSGCGNTDWFVCQHMHRRKKCGTWMYLQIWRPLVSSFLIYLMNASLDSHAAVHPYPHLSMAVLWQCKASLVVAHQ